MNNRVKSNSELQTKRLELFLLEFSFTSIIWIDQIPQEPIFAQIRVTEVEFCGKMRLIDGI